MKWLKYGLLALVAIPALGAVTLYALGQRTDAGRIQTSVEIRQPPSEVWTWLEDPAKFQQWVSWVVEVKDEGPNGVGGRRITRMRDPNMNDDIVEVHSVVKEYDRPRRLVVGLSSPVGFDGQMTYVLEDLGNGRTRLTTDSRWKYHNWLHALLEPMITPAARDKTVSDFQILKTIAERTGPKE